MTQSLPKLVSHYRRALTDTSLQKSEIELEVRFRGVDLPLFEAVLEGLVKKKINVGDGAITYAVNSIMDEPPIARHPHQRVPGMSGQKVNLVRQIVFDRSGKKTAEHYYRKWPLAYPHRVRNPYTLDYIVVLSAEEKLSEPFTSDSNALIRVKCRVSFLTDDLPGKWRIDLTITRSLRGSDAQTTLPKVVQKMFTDKMTPANMLRALDVDDPDSEQRSLYTYEIEAERVPPKSKKGDDVLGPDPIKPAAVTEIANSLLQLANPEYMEEAVYQSEIYHVASFVVEAPALLRRFEHELGLKKLTPQVVSLTRGEYESIYPPTGYYLLDKADGIRSIASARDGHLFVLADKLHKFYAPGFGPDPKGPKLTPEDFKRVTSTTIVDGELVKEGSSLVFHAFDAIAVQGINISRKGYEARVTFLEEAVGLLRDFGVDARAKPVVHLSGSEPDELKAQFLSPVFEKRPYEMDGRILVEPGKSYRETLSYKWKSLWDTTIDFLARRAPTSVRGRLPYVDSPGHELYFLFVGINPNLFESLGLDRVKGYSDLFPKKVGNGSYFPIQFAPSDSPLAYCYQHPTKKPKGKEWEGWAKEIDGKVIELRCAGPKGNCTTVNDMGTPSWQMVRVREDRAREIRTQQYFGNDFRIAELTWLNYVDPFEESQLWEGASSGYFAAPKSAIYRAQTAFTSFVKSQRIESTLPHASWVIDAAIGKGQDLGRYIKAGVRHVVGIDKDQGALSELVRRKFSFAGRGRHHRRGGPTTLFALKADLTDSHTSVAKRVQNIVGFPQKGADALVINLAIHYLADNVVHLRNFAALCKELVRVKGTVIITTMIGQRVHDLLSSQSVGVGQSWDSKQDGVLKYSIRRDYTTNTLTSAGQQVGVLLPFSNGEYYEEYLVNLDTLVGQFKQRGFALVSVPTFDRMFEDFKTRNSTMYDLLTKEDFAFLSLYGEIVLRREK
jgi:hypothetical protein